MRKLRVCLDYGHGGTDPGAIYKARKEADDNLRLGKAVASSLRRKGIVVDETRVDGRYLSLAERVRLSNSKNYDYFISFHRNAFKPEIANGVEVYTYTTASWKAKALARRLQNALVKVGFRDRGVKAGKFYVLRRTKAPAILLEIGFIDNSKDNRIFDSKFKEIAESISREIY